MAKGSELFVRCLENERIERIFGILGEENIDVMDVTFRQEIEALLANGFTQKFIARRYQTTEANLHNWMKKHGIRKPQSASPFG
jgi:hypothetical protein